MGNLKNTRTFTDLFLEKLMIKFENKQKGMILLFTFPILLLVTVFLIIQPLSIPQLMWLNTILILTIIIIQFFFKEKNKIIIMAMLLLSLIVTIRYIYWRTFNTLHFPDLLSAFFGVILYCAEMYSWCVLFIAFFQSLFPLNREVIALSKIEENKPTVDLFIPTYNESLSIVKVTLYAAKNLIWPKHKLNIWLLDDGKRPEFKAFCDEIGIGYIARPTNEHAKAGNLNYALKHTTGEFVAILRRKPLMQIGGIAIETVTEDAHTALKLHRLGYNSAYLKTPLSAGLATETLSGHIGQRIR